MKNEIITGEIVMHKCKMFIGEACHFTYNPNIGLKHNKIKFLDTITEKFDNPDTIFCYGDKVKNLLDKLEYFMNPFTLYSGNSDENIVYNETYLNLANSNKIIKWYAQNLGFSHSKIKLLPIGLSNSQYPHGNLEAFTNIMNNLLYKS